VTKKKDRKAENGQAHREDENAQSVARTYVEPNLPLKHIPTPF
jgi:hypothetical protein